MAHGVVSLKYIGMIYTNVGDMFNVDECTQ